MPIELRRAPTPSDGGSGTPVRRDDVVDLVAEVHRNDMLDVSVPRRDVDQRLLKLCGREFRREPQALF